MRSRFLLGLVLAALPFGRLWAADAATIGASLSFRDAERWQWFGEISAFHMWDTVGLGGSVGSSFRIHYVEIEPFYFGNANARGVVVGVNPGLVFDRSNTDVRLGFQVTAWVWPRIVFGDAGVVPFPIGFLRSQSYSFARNDWSVGLMFKIPVWGR